MIKLDTTLSLLSWLFTPIKLMSDGGLSGVGQGGYGVGGVNDSNSNPNNPGYSGGSGDGGWGGYDPAEEAAKTAAAQAEQAKREALEAQLNNTLSKALGVTEKDIRANAAITDAMFGTDYTGQLPSISQSTEVSNPFTINTKVENPLAAIAFKTIDLSVQTELGSFISAIGSVFESSKAPSLSSTYQAAIPSKPGIMTTAELTNGITTTTTTFDNALGGATTSINSYGMVEEHNSYVTNMNGSIVSHTTSMKIGNSSFSYDTHYWGANNTQFGFAAEVAADMAEFFGAKDSTVRGIAGAVEVAVSIYSVIMPSMQMLGVSSSIMKVNKAVGLIGMIGSMISIYDEVDRLVGMFGEEGWYDPNNTLSNAMLNTFDGGDGERYDLGNVVMDTITNEYYNMLGGTNSNNYDSVVMPQIFAPARLIKPNTNQESNMQSQQAVFIDYRGGLSEVLASNLIGANEGSVYENIDITKGTMQSKKLGTVTTGYLNEYVLKLPNDYSFHSTYKFNSCKLGNFIYITVEDDTYPYIYQLDYQTLDRDCNETDLVQASLIAPTTNPTIVDNLVSKVIVNIDTDDDDSPADTSDNVKSGDIIAIYYGDTEVKQSIALVADDISASVIEVVLDEYYPESDEDQFSYKIIRSTNIINPESNDLTLANESEIESELWEEYVYAYTYYDSDSGFESSPVFSDSFLKKTQAITIEDLEYSLQSNVDYIRLYRIGGYSSSYRLIAEIDNAVEVGTTTYVDSLSEEYTPNLLDTQNLAIIEDLIGLTEHKGTLFAYKNNQVYFSRPGKPNMWSNFNSIRVGGTVSGVASTPLGVLIFTDNSQTYILGGTDSYNFTLSTLTKNIGCISNRSISNYKSTAIWLDYEGLMMSVGSSVTNISKEKVDLTDIGEIIDAMVYDSIYYLVGTNYSMIVDFRYNTPSYQKVQGLEHIHYHKGKIYTQIDSALYEDSFAKVGDYMEMSYKAPMFIGNSYDILTEFEKINLTYKGDYTFKVYVDEVEVLSDTISSTKTVVEEIKIPTNDNEGLGIEFELIGAGEIKSFRYIFSNVNIN